MSVTKEKEVFMPLTPEGIQRRISIRWRMRREAELLRCGRGIRGRRPWPGWPSSRSTSSVPFHPCNQFELRE